MEFLQANATPIITFFTLVSNLVFFGILATMAFNKRFRACIVGFLDKYILHVLFTLTASAVVGSLVYSNIIGFPPCELCWTQRMLMYPQALVFLMAMYWKDTAVVKYVLPLSILGVIIAFYHSLAHWGFNSAILDCTAVGGDCAKVYVLEYGYITIPFMSLTVFVYMAVISAIYLKNNAR